MFPSQWLSQGILQALVLRDMALKSPGTLRFLDTTLMVPIPFVLTIGQYYLIGLILDRSIDGMTCRAVHHTPEAMVYDRIFAIAAEIANRSTQPWLAFSLADNISVVGYLTALKFAGLAKRVSAIGLLYSTVS